jgi:flagellar motility protein MotE (MotC chaperone)
MSAIIRILFPLIGYVCVATVISIAAGYGYLRHTEVLDDQRMFRIVSLLHGIDLDEIAKTYEGRPEDVPPEELSHDQQQEQIQVASLHLQAKQDDLEKVIEEFTSRFEQLNIKIARYNNLRNEVETFLNQERDKALDSGIVAVINQLKNLSASKQAKPIIVDMITDDRMDDVIRILNGMPPRNSDNILKAFTTEKELKILYDLEKRMMGGDPEKSFVDSKMDELKQGLDQN